MIGRALLHVAVPEAVADAEVADEVEGCGGAGTSITVAISYLALGQMDQLDGEHSWKSRRSLLLLLLTTADLVTKR